MTIPPASAGRKALGNWGEDQAAAYVASLGFQLITRNWRTRSGEIDLIAQEDETLIFVEVRTRRSTGRYGLPEESVDYKKQRQLRDMAQQYLRYRGNPNLKCRFDVIAVTGSSDGSDGSEAAIRHIPHAF